VSDTRTDELTEVRRELAAAQGDLAAARGELAALRGAYCALLESEEGSSVQVSTGELRDLDLEALAASYEDILRRPGLPRAWRTWYSDLLEGLRSVQARRREQLCVLAAELNLPPSWQAVAALEADEA
jgi:hypothetical protein